MSNTNTNLQTKTSNALHNAIMEAGGKDRPPMLAPGVPGKVESPLKVETSSYFNYNQNGKEPTVVAEDDEMSKDKEIDKLMALISLSFKKIYKPTNNNLRTSSNTSRANQDNTLRINRGTGYDNQRVVNVAGARENVDKELEAYYMYMAQIQEVTPDAADNSGPIFDVEPLQKVQNNDDNYNVFAIESEHPEQPESVNDTYPVEQDEHNIIIDSLDMSYNPLDSDETILFPNKGRSKLIDLIRPFDYEKLNNLYDLFISQREKSAEQRYFSERTKQPIAVPISTREPKRTMNQSVATSHKKTVATESTVKKPRNTTRKLYEHVSKTCSWWYPKFTPSGYKWKPKSPIGNVNTNVSMPLGNASRTGCPV
ncbi:hypothetical protein Tco_1249975 [Tanacetum coccineum]